MGGESSTYFSEFNLIKKLPSNFYIIYISLYIRVCHLLWIRIQIWILQISFGQGCRLLYSNWIGLDPDTGPDPGNYSSLSLTLQDSTLCRARQSAIRVLNYFCSFTELSSPLQTVFRTNPVQSQTLMNEMWKLIGFGMTEGKNTSSYK